MDKVEHTGFEFNTHDLDDHSHSTIWSQPPPTLLTPKDDISTSSSNSSSSLSSNEHLSPEDYNSLELREEDTPAFSKTDKELKASITRDMAKRKEAFRIDERAKLRHEIQAAVDEKRCNRQSVRGIDIDSAKKLLKSGKLKRPNAKIQ